MSVIEKIEKLIARANSPNENEARTSAVIACKLIMQHKIQLSMPDQVSAERPAPRTEHPDDVMRNGEPVDLSGTLADTFFNAVARGKQRYENATRETPPPREAPVTINAPHDGTCVDCGTPYGRDDRVWFMRGVGAVHAFRCDPNKLVAPRPRRT